MQKKDYLILFIICAIPFIIYLSGTPYVAGADSYYYLDRICNQEQESALKTFVFLQSGYDPIFNGFIGFFPCNFLFIKIYLFILFFGIVLICAKTCEVMIQKDNAGLFGGIVGAVFSFMIFDFFQFENDTLGYFVGFLALYFLLRFYKNKKYIELAIAGALLLVGALIWQGVIYWTLPFLIIIPVSGIIIVPLIIYLWPQFIWFASGDGAKIAEQVPLISIIYWGLLIFFFYRFPKINKKIGLIIIILCIPGLFVAKLFVLPILFMVIMATDALLSLKINRNTIITTLIIFGLMMAFMYGTISLRQFPTKDDVELVKGVIGQSKYIQNDYGVGWVIQWSGGIPSSKGGTLGGVGIDYNFSGYVINNAWDDNKGCKILQKSQNLQSLNCN